MKHPPSKYADIGREIGFFFLAQNNEDYQKTGEFLRNLCITDIREENDKLVIETARPGLLIGQKGRNIDGLVEHLKRPIHILESFCWADVITPIDWMAEIEMEQEAEAYASFSSFIEEEARLGSL
jgi:hypothetical protein